MLKEDEEMRKYRNPRQNNIMHHPTSQIPDPGIARIADIPPRHVKPFDPISLNMKSTIDKNNIA